MIIVNKKGILEVSLRIEMLFEVFWLFVSRPKVFFCVFEVNSADFGFYVWKHICKQNEFLSGWLF